jgi:Leu/Phe-tRNA-protein transferase
MDNLEENFSLQIISVIIVLAASSIPIHFALKIKTERQRILSSFLFAALIAYSIHSLLESFELVNYQVFTKLCFILSAFGLMAAYSFYQFRTNHALIGGIFGIAMIAAFGMWMVGELVEAIIITTTTSATEDGEYGIKTIDSISSTVMAGFGIFLIARFFWLRSVMPIEPKYLRS